MIEPATNPIPTTLWTYQSTSDRVIDGDTVDFYVDRGMYDFTRVRLRLLGVNTPEIKGETREAGRAASAYTADWLAVGIAEYDDDWPFLIHTQKDDVFGRYLAVIWRRSDGRCLNDDLVRDGHAVIDIR